MNYRKNPDTRRKFSAYSDESGCFSEHYQSVGVISGEKGHLSRLRNDLGDVIQEKEINEVKFSEVRTHRPKLEAAQLFIEKGIDFAKQRHIRIDVLLWDTHDRRHSIPGRDDVANLERMYYKVLRHISEQWNHHYWELYPDEGSEVNWHEIKSYLRKTRIPRYKPHFLCLFDEEAYTINFYDIEPKRSHDEPLIQISDLFAGIACFCRENGDECVKWLQSQKEKNQQLLFDYEEPKTTEDPNKIKRNRFVLVGKLNERCKQYRLGVSLKTRKHLWTPEPSNPINFWNYEPQHEEDKAPTG